MELWTNLGMVERIKVLIIFFLCPNSLPCEPPRLYSLHFRVVVHRIRSNLLAQRGIQDPSKYLNLSLERRVGVNHNAQES